MLGIAPSFLGVPGVRTTGRGIALVLFLGSYATLVRTMSYSCYIVEYGSYAMPFVGLCLFVRVIHMFVHAIHVFVRIIHGSHSSCYALVIRVNLVPRSRSKRLYPRLQLDPEGRGYVWRCRRGA